MGAEMGIEDRRSERGWRIARWGGAALLLLAPLVAMQVTDEVSWSAGDFALFAAMLVTACGAYEAALRLTRSRARRVGIAFAIFAAFFLVWLQLAAGIVD